MAKGRELLLNDFRWTDVASRLVDSARDCARAVEMEAPRIGWISTWNTRCGIATYSSHLIENLSSEVTILAPYTEDFTQPDDARVSRCWVVGESDELSELSASIEKSELNVLVIQFNYGFFKFEAFAEFLDRQIDAGRVVLVTLHSTCDPIHVLPHKRLKVIKNALSRCHRLLVHSIKDLNRLKSLDLIENVALFPHGVKDFSPVNIYKPDISIHSASWTVASYGFVLPHKGLLELIEACALLRAIGVDVRLKMVNSEYPIPESTALINEARSRISAHGLDAYVELNTAYLPDEESLALLSQADLIIFPYQETGESSSAAVRSGLAVGRPVAVTPIPIFEDVLPAVHLLPGPTPQQLSVGIETILRDISSCSVLAQSKAETADRWRCAHRYSMLGARLNDIISALVGLKRSGPFLKIFEGRSE